MQLFSSQQGVETEDEMRAKYSQVYQKIYKTSYHMFRVKVFKVRLKFYKKNVPRLFGRWTQ